MKGMKRWAGLLAAASMGMGMSCEPIDDGGGGGAGLDFTQGFVFLRADRNLWVLQDGEDPSSPVRLTEDGRVQHPAVARTGGGVSVFFVRKTATGAELQRLPTRVGEQATPLFSTTDAACNGCTGLRSPAYSAQSRSVVFVIERGTGAPTSLGRVSEDGSGFQELTPGTTLAFGAPSFLPDGQRVLAPAGNSLNDLRQLAEVRLDGASAPRFFNGALGNEALRVVSRAVVSPDGSRVAFDGEVSSGAARLFVAPLSSTAAGALQLGTPVAVTDHPGEVGVRDTFPSWMGANQLGFLSNSGGADNVYRLTVNTSAPGAGSLVVPSALEPMYGPL